MNVFNHYPFLGLSVSTKLPNGTSKTLAVIPAQESRGILLIGRDPVMLDIFLLPEMDRRRGSVSNTLDKMVLLMQIEILPHVPELHLGQVSSRIINKHWVNGEQNALGNQGLKRLTLHNQTNLPIQFDNHLVIPPRETAHWSGRERYGVPIGTTFTAVDGLYPPFVVDRPITDIYYGLATTVEQPKHGGQQPVFSEHPAWGSYPFMDGDV